MPKTYLKNSITVTLLLSSIMAFVLLSPTLKRGLFFREDYLPYLSRIAVLFAIVSFVAILKGDSIWRGDVDIILAVIAGLYFLTNIWAQSKMNALDGALKYGGYLMVLVMARYASASELGSRILRNLLILSGVVVASTGYLTAAGLAEYPSAVRSGALLGSFQYPNALASYAMFLLFFLYYAWYEGFSKPPLDLIAGLIYSVSAFLLVGSVFLTNSRATVLMFLAFMALYGVLLPKGPRARIFMRVSISFVSFAVVGSMMDNALRENDPASMRQGLAIGLALATALELGRWLWDRKTSLQREATSEAATASSSAESQSMVPKTIFMRVAAAALIIMMVALGLISAAKNPSAAEVLSRVLPARFISQLKTLTLNDKSLLIRFAATRDAFSIAVDHPFGTGAGGWDALYHQYQRTPYWFTETHNQFAQMLVEVGFPGLFLSVAFWGLLAYAIAKTYLSTTRAATVTLTPSSNFTAKVTSSSLAVFALCVHSAIDFDLSLPAIAVSLYASIAILLSEIEEWVPRLRNNTSLPKKTPKTHKRDAQVTFPWAMVTTVLAAAILVLSIWATANRLYSGLAYGSTAVRTMQSGDLAQARRYMAEAMERDKGNPAYALEMASWSAEDYVTDRDPVLGETARLYLKMAEATHPNNISRQMIEYQLLVKMGLIDEALDSAYGLILMMPTNRAYYEYLSDLGRTSMAAHANALTQTKLSDTEKQKHLDNLAACSELLSSAFDMLDAKRERVTGIDEKIFNPNGLNFTAKIALAAGEVAFLKGEIETSGTLLEAAAKDKNLAQEANTWLAFLVEASGYNATFPQDFMSDREVTRTMACLFGAIRQAE